MTATFTRRAARVIAATGLAFSAALVGTPATAAPSGTLITTPNGMVGVPQALFVRAPGSVGQSVDLQLTLGPAVLTVAVAISSNGFGQTEWTPAGAGAWTVTGLGPVAGASSAFTVVPMPTYTQIAAPAQLQPGVPGQLAANVIAPIGALAPAGTVTFSEPDGEVLGTVTVQSTASPNVAFAALEYQPSESGIFPVQATYTPSSGGQLGSTSPVGMFTVSAAPLTVTPRWPSVIYAGEPVGLQAVATPEQPEGGVVDFGFSLTLTNSGPAGMQAGTATYEWTPPFAGLQSITLGYSHFKNGASGSIVQSLDVQQPRPVDVITVTTPQQGTWSAATPVTMAANSVVPLTATSASGTPVLFFRTGPCAIDGAMLSAVGSGECQVTAFTPGTSTIRPGWQTYNVAIGAAVQAKRVNAGLR